MAFQMTVSDYPAEIRLTPGFPEDHDTIERVFNLCNEGDFVVLVRKNAEDGKFFLTTDRSLVLPNLYDDTEHAAGDPVVEDTEVFDSLGNEIEE